MGITIITNIINSPSLRDQWTELCLEWSLQIEDPLEPQISLDCFKLFTILNSGYSLPLLQKIQLFLFKTMMHNEKEKTTAIYDFLTKIPSDVCTPEIPPTQ